MDPLCVLLGSSRSPKSVSCDVWWSAWRIIPGLGYMIGVMSGFGHLFGALVFGRYHYSLLRILSYVYLIVLGVGAPIPLLIMHWNFAQVLLNFWQTPVWLLSFLVWLARRFFMESFSILALNRPLRWLGSDTWEALSNSFALNIWHNCRKTWESCCCLNHCGLCRFHFNFRLLWYLFLFIHSCVATTCWCDQGYRATHLPLTYPVGGKRPSVNHEPWTMVSNHGYYISDPSKLVPLHEWLFTAYKLRLLTIFKSCKNLILQVDSRRNGWTSGNPALKLKNENSVLTIS